MLAGKAYMELHYQEAGIIHRNICAEYGPEAPGSRWEAPPNVIENEWVKIHQIEGTREAQEIPRAEGRAGKKCGV